MKAIPEVGKEYYFFDDGKISPSRCYKAKVTKVIPYTDSKDITLMSRDPWVEDLIPKTLHDIHKAEAEDCSWIFSEDTDHFIECDIPGYDKNHIFFARTIDGGWFSMDIQSGWQGGRLDIDGEIYKDAKNYFDNSYWSGWYEQELREKGELI